MTFRQGAGIEDGHFRQPGVLIGWRRDEGAGVKDRLLYKRDKASYIFRARLYFQLAAGNRRHICDRRPLETSSVNSCVYLQLMHERWRLATDTENLAASHHHWSNSARYTTQNHVLPKMPNISRWSRSQVESKQSTAFTFSHKHPESVVTTALKTWVMRIWRTGKCRNALGIAFVYFLQWQLILARL